MSTATRERRPAGPSVRLVGPGAAPRELLVPDEAQAALIERRQGSGPVVVFGAPGTGKTTALIEAVAARVERDGLSPGAVLSIAPTRVASARLRERLSARIGGTVQEPISRTPHSYAFGLLHRALSLDGDPSPRLISGPEQDRMLADLLAGHAEGLGSAPVWPSSTGEEIRQLRGFRDELRDLLMRAVERGLTPEDLRRLGQLNDRPDWLAAADVMSEYLDVTALSTPNAYDPAGIVDAATELLLSDDELLGAEQDRRRLVVVDDAHELTVAAEHLLRLVAGGGRDLILAGDPDSAVQTFRGARPSALADAVQRFRRADGGQAAVITLGRVYRHGPALRAVAGRVAERIGAAGTASQRVVTAAGSTSSTIGVEVFASPAREGAYIAQHLRRLHLEQQVPWQRMAVIVRSTKATGPLRRSLGAAGVPVAIPTAEVPVRDEIAVVPLRLALRCALRPGQLTAEVASDLLTSAIGGADAIAVRRLRQALRTEELASGGGRASDELLVEALLDPARLAVLEPRVSAPARRVATVLGAGREAAGHENASPETVLWEIWDRTGLAISWRRTALSGGVAGTRADRDLDAVMALFEAAARFTDRFPGADAQAFLDHLEAQDVPADTLAERAPTDEAVALVTATAAAGLEWDVVAVAGVQEGDWPNLQLRDSLLGGQRLAEVVDGRGDLGFVAQRKAIQDDELRLFHVAVSRARRHLLVTAVRSDEVMPSTFLDLVDPDSAEGEQEVRPLAEVPRMMTLPALVAQLRAVVVDPLATRSRREAAARQLARLALAGVPGADPGEWYGLAPVSVAGPLREPSALVRVSPSQVEAFGRCSLRWLLNASGGRRSSSTAQGLGDLVHQMAEEVPDGNLVKLRTLLAERFSRLGLGQGWVADTERARAEAMISKLAAYTAEAKKAGRTLVATEQSVKVEVGRAQIVGKVDRVEQDAQGRLVVIDLKTGRSAPTRAEVARHAQLGVYQVAVEEGGLARAAAQAGLRVPEGIGAGGAALVQLGRETVKVTVQQQPPLASDPEPGWASDLVHEAAEGMGASEFPARSNSMCHVCDVRRTCPLRNEGRQVGR
ncbi:ATP-dependent helicase [Kineosporia succinea]|uniref:DNA 3'-5' helicase n=1 Tax=Kineosporia succinea TaxID=84632 RepID=A0ABT9NZP0_9ACTN|nr:ATP-dependent DNA helicase [Kineosporia succinea]MDP9825435.1 superfamily I DNA/RNA helicase/RecB family exonuclease [Kineosporia succinea]